MGKIRVANRRTPQGGAVVVSAKPIVSVLNALLGEGVSIRHDCGGKAQCGTCRYRVLDGATALSPRRGPESERLAAVAAAGELPPGGEYRLACQSHAAGEVEIELLL